MKTAELSITVGGIHEFHKRLAVSDVSLQQLIAIENKVKT